MSTQEQVKKVQALTKYARMSPKKVQDVARVIVGKPAEEALDLLKLIPRKSAKLLHKTLRSAVANAENNHDMSSESLVVERALVEQGPAFARFRPTARGSAHRYKKHTSHIRIILTEAKN